MVLGIGDTVDFTVLLSSPAGHTKVPLRPLHCILYVGASSFPTNFKSPNPITAGVEKQQNGRSGLYFQPRLGRGPGDTHYADIVPTGLRISDDDPPQLTASPEAMVESANRQKGPSGEEC